MLPHNNSNFLTCQLDVDEQGHTHGPQRQHQGSQLNDVFSYTQLSLNHILDLIVENQYRQQLKSQLLVQRL